MTYSEQMRNELERATGRRYPGGLMAAALLMRDMGEVGKEVKAYRDAHQTLTLRSYPTPQSFIRRAEAIAHLHPGAEVEVSETVALVWEMGERSSAIAVGHELLDITLAWATDKTE